LKTGCDELFSHLYFGTVAKPGYQQVSTYSIGSGLDFNFAQPVQRAGFDDLETIAERRPQMRHNVFAGRLTDGDDAHGPAVR
jgi:hypothetical protein